MEKKRPLYVPALYCAAFLAALLWTRPAFAGEYSNEERKLLRDIAEESIAAKLAGEKYALPKDLPEHLVEVRGAFVTLKRNGRLRGCIGNVIGDEPLAETVAGMARAAAFSDPRFPPLARDEFPGLDIEISVLTPPRKVDSPEEVKVGEHGLIMRSAFRAGLLLPQVATEYGWDRTAFLEQTCRKAGMDKDCWKDPDTTIEVFSAEVF